MKFHLMDSVPRAPGASALQVLEQRIGVATVDLDLAKHGKADTVVQLAEFHDLVVAARVLLAKLVAGKAQNLQTLVLVLLVHFLEPGELWRETALGRSVDNQQYFAFVVGEGFFLPPVVWQLKSYTLLLMVFSRLRRVLR